MPRRSPVVELSVRTREHLERLSASRTRSARLVERASVVSMAADGLSDVEIAARLRVDTQRVRRWRHRWLKGAQAVHAAEHGNAPSRELERVIEAVLNDAPRSGGPPKFSAEQVAQLVALACEPPADSGLPVTHWTPKELAQEAVKRGIVESISARHLDRLLKRGGPAPAQESLLDDLARQARES